MPQPAMTISLIALIFPMVITLEKSSRLMPFSISMCSRIILVPEPDSRRIRRSPIRSDSRAGGAANGYFFPQMGIKLSII